LRFIAEVSEQYTPDNLLDRIVSRSVVRESDEHSEAREAALIRRHLGLTGGEVLSVGCGWHPGRHLFPKPAWRLVATDIDPERPQACIAHGEADEGFTGEAGRLEVSEASFDVVLYRRVLHHVIFHGDLWPVFVEAARVLRPGGALVAIEPGLYHPAGLALAAANRVGLGVALHGTPDDVPLSPRRLMVQTARVGLVAEVHAVSYVWRHMPVRLQRLVRPLDRLGSLPGARMLGHTFLLLARKPR
jgi:SAM-dependent methyltransferase